MRSTVKNRLLRNWIGHSGQQEYKALERSLARENHQKKEFILAQSGLAHYDHRIHCLRLPSELGDSSFCNGKRGETMAMEYTTTLQDYKMRSYISDMQEMQWSTLLSVLPDALYTDRCHYFECILGLMTRKEFEEFDRIEDMASKPTTPSTVRTLIDGSGTGSVTEHTSSTTSVSSSTTLGSGYPFTDSSAFWSLFQQYRKVLTQTLQYAIDRLNQKGVYSNVIAFCARILAICFFKLPGVAFGLLHALPVSRSYISRMAKSMGITGDQCGMTPIVGFFPEHLSPICFIGTRSWWRDFDKLKCRMNMDEGAPPMEMFGNWVRRWQSDDSELFFAFYRHYHHCLAQYLEAPLQRIQAGGWASSAITAKVYAGAPGYLYLSAFFLTKIEGLVHREIHPVTTIVQFEPNAANGNGTAEKDRAMASVATGEFPGSAAPPAVKMTNGADAGKDGANGAATGKPKVLDMASRRFVETIVAIMEDHGSIYGAMLDIWIKAAVTKTSIYDVESVFCLLDFLDMLIAELDSRDSIHLYDSELSAGPSNAGTSGSFVPINLQFILSTLHLLLTASDHTITLMRTLSFIYQNFSLLTSTVQTLEQLALGTLLSPDVFERCFLHWARNVRLYYMRCLVWRVARIGGGVGVLPGWKAWMPESPPLQHDQTSSAIGGMASSGISTNESSTKKTAQEALEEMRGLPIEQSLGMIVRNILEIMESRIDMTKRQFAGELTDIMSPTMSDKDSEFSPESMPPSPGPELTPPVSLTGSSVAPSPRLRSLAEQDEESWRSQYQFQTQQIYQSHQILIQSDDSTKAKDKDRAKRSGSRSSLIGRRFRRLSKAEGANQSGGSEAQPQKNPADGDLHRHEPAHANHATNATMAGKRTNTGSAPLTAGNLFRWIFLGGQGSDKDDARPGSSRHSLASVSTTSSNSLTIQAGSNDQFSDTYSHIGASRTYGSNGPSILRYEVESRKYPEHLTIYAGRAITEHIVVLNEYVDWLTQCHAYGIKSRMSYAPNGATPGVPQPGGVPGIGLGPTGPGSAENLFVGFSVFSLSMNSVVDANTIAGHLEEWISPGMAHMMMLRFPGLMVEWPKYWNNSRDASGPPPGPITTLSSLAVVNNPMFSMGKGAAGGVSVGISAGAGGAFGGVNLNGTCGNGPSSLKHQQQAQLHHQQQMQLWSRNAAVAAAAAAASSSSVSASGTPGSGFDSAGVDLSPGSSTFTTVATDCAANDIPIVASAI
ncbi:hypothetical protein BGX31_006626 [Mortierella sp. GBA43]|nr:hypothetical protein BGX31_006626 [Mortierella sp. GBA43]